MFNMCTYFNNFCNCGINNLFMPFGNFFQNSLPFFNFGNFMPNFTFPPVTSPFMQIGNPFQMQSTGMSFMQGNIFQTPSLNCQMPAFSDNIWNMPGMNMNYGSFGSFGNFGNFGNFDTFIPSTTGSKSSNKQRFTGPLQSQLVQRAQSYVGKVNSDTEGNKLFSRGQNRPWCADFVSSVVHDTYGSKLPSNFPARQTSVAALKSWGESSSRFLKLPASNKAEFIAKNIKPGDIVIITKDNGKGHTGIVTKVNSDGSFETVEGNYSNSVKNVTRTIAKTKGLAGFISMDGIG